MQYFGPAKLRLEWLLINPMLWGTFHEKMNKLILLNSAYESQYKFKIEARVQALNVHLASSPEYFME